MAMKLIFSQKIKKQSTDNKFEFDHFYNKFINEYKEII